MSRLAISIDFADVTEERAVVPVTDRGFLYGDSVYEVVRTWQGRLLFADEHLERLTRSAAGIHLQLEHDAQRYRRELARVHALSGFTESSLRLIVTRGSGPMQLGETSGQQRVIVIAKPLAQRDPLDYQRGVSVVLSRQARDGISTLDPTLKTGKYVTNMIAAQEAARDGAEEALMLNRAGFVTECTTSNIFFVRNQVLSTPALEQGVLAGITRAKVIELARAMGMGVEEGDYSLETLQSADEVFITSSSRELLPVTKLMGSRVGEGEPGPTTKKLLFAYRDLCAKSVG